MTLKDHTQEMINALSGNTNVTVVRGGSKLKMFRWITSSQQVVSRRIKTLQGLQSVYSVKLTTYKCYVPHATILKPNRRNKMQLSERNQIGNAKNPYQGKAIKALCVCSAGLLRSPTIARELTLRGYNTRACGTSEKYALVYISEALIHWADEIHVVKGEARYLETCLLSLFSDKKDRPKVIVYDLPDIYGTFDPQLNLKIQEKLDE